MNIRQLTASAAVASGGALLFAIQPMIAKTLLPAFGGSAGVWVTCMMFFQVALLLGYLYSFAITRYVGPALGTAIHLALLGASLAALPVRPAAGWSSGNPTLAVLTALGWSVGLPFFVLSTINPMVQSWCAGARGAKLPYWLFAVSNVACLLALLAYPLAIEPAATVGGSCAGGPWHTRRWWRWSRWWRRKAARGRRTNRRRKHPARRAARPPSTGHGSGWCWRHALRCCGWRWRIT